MLVFTSSDESILYENLKLSNDMKSQGDLPAKVHYRIVNEDMDTEEYPYTGGKLALVKDPECKMRIIAMSDY
jgi:hypothetical protein